MLKPSNLRNYQKSMIRMMVRQAFCLLSVDMGLGKTVCALSAAAYLIKKQKVSRILVVAPPRVARTVWPQEFKTWSHLSDLSYKVVEGAITKRTKQLNQPADFYFISSSLLTWLQKQIKTGEVPVFDGVIIDESSMYKNPQAARTKAMIHIASKALWRVALTGTPAPNSLLDLHQQYRALDGGERLYKSYYRFRHLFFYQAGFDYKPKDCARQKIYDLVDDITLSASQQDYLELPEQIYLDETVELSAELKRRYDKFARDLVLSIEDDDITAANAAVVTNKLEQFASGAIYHTDWNEDAEQEERKTIALHDEKIQALDEIREQTNYEPVIIAYRFKSELYRLQEHFGDKAVTFSDHKDAAKEWNAGHISVLLINPASAGHGLNLQYGGRRIIWYNLTWSLELWQQTNKRLHRSGQEDTVFIHRIVTKDTVDESIQERLEGKAVNQMQFIEEMKLQLEENCREAI